jgi:hypothetical protein
MIILLRINVIFAMAVEDDLQVMKDYCAFMIEQNFNACTLARAM